MTSAGKLVGFGGGWLLLYAAAVFPASSEEWATLTFDPATSSSRCIGNPMTPLCAVETHKACFLWNDADEIVDEKVCTVMGIDPTTFTFRALTIYGFALT